MTPPRLRLDEPRPAPPPPGLSINLDVRVDPPADLGEVGRVLPKALQVDAWAERGGDQGPSGPEGRDRGPRVDRVGAKVGLDSGGDGGDAPALEGGARSRRTGILAPRSGEGATPLDGDELKKVSLESRYPIRSTGMSAADVSREAKRIDADGDGKLSQTEIDKFSALAGAKGFQDAAARDAFRRYEAGAAMLSTQVKGGASKSYLDGAWTKQMEKLPGTAADIAEVRKTLLPQAHGHIAKDVVPELAKITESGIDARDLAAARGVLKSKGYSDVAIIDSDGDGRVTDKDHFVGASSIGVTKAPITAMNEINAARGLNRAMEAYEKNKPAFLARSRSDALPSSSWDYEAKATPGGEPLVGWKLKAGVKGSDAVKQFRDSPGSFKCDCATAKQMFELNALMEQMGEAKFDALVAKNGLYVGFGAAHANGDLAKKVTKDVGDPSLAVSDYDAGWMGYAQISVAGHPELAGPLADAGWAGEHFVVSVNDKGEKQVLAHPFGAIAAADFESHLRAKVKATIGDPSIKDSDIIITYKQPTSYDPDKAKKAL